MFAKLDANKHNIKTNEINKCFMGVIFNILKKTKVYAAVIAAFFSVI